MVTTTNPEVLRWKHKKEGIRCKQNDRGEMEIVGWPKGLSFPTQAEVDGWEAEYLAQQKPKDDAAENIRQQALKDATFDLLIYLADKPALIAGMPQYLKDYVADGKTYIAQRDA